jgi:hypothetical protein
MMEVNVEMILADSMDGVYSNKTYGDRRPLGPLCSCGQWQTSGVQPFHSWLHVGRFDYTADYLCCMMDKQKEIQMSFSLLLSELGWQVAM